MPDTPEASALATAPAPAEATPAQPPAPAGGETAAAAAKKGKEIAKKAAEGAKGISKDLGDRLFGWMPRRFEGFELDRSRYIESGYGKFKVEDQEMVHAMVTRLHKAARDIKTLKGPRERKFTTSTLEKVVEARAEKYEAWINFFSHGRQARYLPEEKFALDETDFVIGYYDLLDQMLQKQMSAAILVIDRQDQFAGLREDVVVGRLVDVLNRPGIDFENIRAQLSTDYTREIDFAHWTEAEIRRDLDLLNRVRSRMLRTIAGPGVNEGIYRQMGTGVNIESFEHKVRLKLHSYITEALTGESSARGILPTETNTETILQLFYDDPVEALRRWHEAEDRAFQDFLFEEAEGILNELDVKEAQDIRKVYLERINKRAVEHEKKKPATAEQLETQEHQITNQNTEINRQQSRYTSLNTELTAAEASLREAQEKQTTEVPKATASLAVVTREIGDMKTREIALRNEIDNSNGQITALIAHYDRQINQVRIDRNTTVTIINGSVLPDDVKIAQILQEQNNATQVINALEKDLSDAVQKIREQIGGWQTNLTGILERVNKLTDKEADLQGTIAEVNNRVVAINARITTLHDPNNLNDALGHAGRTLQEQIEDAQGRLRTLNQEKRDLEAGEPSDEDKRLARAEKKLHDVGTNDFPKIAKEAITGRAEFDQLMKDLGDSNKWCERVRQIIFDATDKENFLYDSVLAREILSDSNLVKYAIKFFNVDFSRWALPTDPVTGMAFADWGAVNNAINTSLHQLHELNAKLELTNAEKILRDNLVRDLSRISQPLREHLSKILVTKGHLHVGNFIRYILEDRMRCGAQGDPFRELEFEESDIKYLVEPRTVELGRVGRFTFDRDLAYENSNFTYEVILPNGRHIRLNGQTHLRGGLHYNLEVQATSSLFEEVVGGAVAGIDAAIINHFGVPPNRARANNGWIPIARNYGADNFIALINQLEAAAAPRYPGFSDAFSGGIGAYFVSQTLPRSERALFFAGFGTLNAINDGAAPAAPHNIAMDNNGVVEIDGIPWENYIKERINTIRGPRQRITVAEQQVLRGELRPLLIAIGNRAQVVLTNR